MSLLYPIVFFALNTALLGVLIYCTVRKPEGWVFPKWSLLFFCVVEAVDLACLIMVSLPDSALVRGKRYWSLYCEALPLLSIDVFQVSGLLFHISLPAHAETFRLCPSSTYLTRKAHQKCSPCLWLFYLFKASY